MTVAELLDSPEKWTKGAIARDENGDDSIWEHDSKARCWCLTGAVFLCYGCPSFSVLEKLENILADEGFGDCEVSTWNDAPERTFEDVRRVIEKAGI